MNYLNTISYLGWTCQIQVFCEVLCEGLIAQRFHLRKQGSKAQLSNIQDFWYEIHCNIKHNDVIIKNKLYQAFIHQHSS